MDNLIVTRSAQQQTSQGVSTQVEKRLALICQQVSIFSYGTDTFTTF